MTDTESARYVYSVIRVVPQPLTGEYINIAAIAGSEATGDWSVRQVQNDRRARALAADADALAAVYAFVADIGNQIDLHDWTLESSEDVSQESLELSEAWLTELCRRSRNVVQLSRPAPVLAASAEEALDYVFDSIVIDPVVRHRDNLTKHRAFSALHHAYVAAGLRPNDVRKRVTVAAGVEARFSTPVDFVVANGRAVQLAHTWSFQGMNQSVLLQEVKAWGWTMRELREAGGIVRDTRRGPLSVPNGVDIAVVVIPPQEGSASAAYEEAQAVFQELQIDPRLLGEESVVGEAAREQLNSEVGRTPLV